MQWVFMFFLVAMPTMGCGFVQTEDYISEFDMLIPMAQVFGVLGETASLPCNTQPLSADDRVMKVLWFKEEDGIPLNSYEVRDPSTYLPTLMSAPTGFSSRVFFEANAIPSTLLIKNVRTNDAGLYRCRVHFKNSPVRNFKVNLTVIIPMAQVFGVLGETASLPCNTQPLSADDRVMKVLWFKEEDGIPLNSYEVRDPSTYLPTLMSAPTGFSSRVFFEANAIPSTLLIKNVRTNDAGLYRCRVHFKNSPVRNFKVNLTVIIPMAQVFGVLGETASLPCNTQPLSADDRVMKVLWFKEEDGIPLNSYEVRDPSTYLPTLMSAPTGFSSRVFFEANAIPSTLLIKNVRTNDAGLYRCRVHFKNSPVRNFKVNLTVIIPMAQVFGVLGETASLPCNTQPLSADDRVMKVLWFKEEDGIPLNSYEVRDPSTYLPTLMSAPTGFSSRVFFEANAIPSTLLIKNVRTNDAGLYRCRVHFKNSPVRNFKVNLTVISKGSAFALSLVTASLLAMMVGAAAAVSVAVYRKYSARRHTEQSVPPLRSVDSVESLPKRENLPLCTLSQKVDSNTQYELKANDEVEDDPEMIPVHYDKKPSDDNCKSKVGEGSTVKIYSDHAASLRSAGNISFVNRGVTPRGCDLCFCETCIQSHFQSTRF